MGLALSVAVALVAAGCAAPGEQGDSALEVVGGPDQNGYHGNYMDPPYAMPELTFTDTSGEEYHLAEDTTKPLTLVFFGYTNCPDICPTVLADSAAAIRRMPAEQKGDVQLVFITTDPDRDTPEAIREYLDRFDESFVGLTADMDTIEQAADDLVVEIEPKRELSGGGYATDHGSHVIGFNAKDEGWLLWTPSTAVGDLRADYTRFLAEQQ
ncbi:SCO family protein [Nocardiopsis gilva YIM 90087]|uniref:SCO family protein n=1 Tax=Nocardiopsis gilva YIM 90087 TaxID=1235441 RepID=A0A223S127_9ACTN|nr:SCO family protein [Nocardiopsis gilva YIM 90087]